MKYLIKSIVILIMAIIVSIVLLPIGFVYSLGYSIWLAITMKDLWVFFRFWWNLIDGLAYAIGHILFNIGLALDLMWNVNGEILEDGITAEESTTFSDKGTTVSASVGKLEIDGDLNKTGKWFSKVLNLVFWQKAHAVDSWNFQVVNKKLKDNYFSKLK